MTTHKLRALCGMILIGSMAAAGPALAANEAMKMFFKTQLENGNITQQQYDNLLKALEQDNQAMEKAVEEKVSEATKDMPEITTKEKFAVKSQDGNFEWGIGGRVMADAAFYEDDDDVNGNSTMLGSGNEIRRARLEMKGKLWKVWGLKVQVDFAGNAVDLKDAFISYAGYEPMSIKVGHFKEPFSLEELTSSKYITFMERSLPNTFAPGRAVGAMVNGTAGDMVTWAGGVFGDGLDTSNSTDNDAGYGITGRLTFSPIHEDSRIIHLGAAASYRSTDDTDTLRFRERMESHISSVRLVDTGNIAGADDFTRYGLEAAGVYDRFSLQGEYINTDVSRQSGFGGDVNFDGYYIYGSVFLTDDHRAYDFEEGAFDKVSPSSVVGKGGIGAWELGLRFSSLNLDDGLVAGGEIDDMTIGLNWYATKNIRFMANYVQVLDSSTSTGPLPGAEPSVVQARAQVFW